MSRTSTLMAAASTILAAAIPSSAALAARGATARGAEDISVQNQRDESVQVHIDGVFVGILPGGAKAAFPADEGRHRVELLDEDGDVILSRRVMVERRERARVRLKGGDGTLQLSNDSDISQSILVTDRDGQMFREVLVAGEEIELRVTPGEVAVAASGMWFGRSALLSREDIMVPPGRTATLELPEVESALLRVQNLGEERLEVYLDDERLGLVRGDSVALFQAPVGTHELMLKADGMEVGERTVVVSEQDGGRMAVRAVRSDLSIVNASSTVGRILVDGEMLGWMEPGEERIIEVYAGERDLQLVGQGGRLLAQTEVTVRAREEFRWVARPGSRLSEDQRRRRRQRSAVPGPGSG
jgi:hypothetical protein